MFANMTHSLLPVIMAGGSGTRLWPLSRALYPKQFLVLTGNQSLFQQAHLRLQSLAAADITDSARLRTGMLSFAPSSSLHW